MRDERIGNSDDTCKLHIEMRVGNAHRGYEFDEATVHEKGQFVVVYSEKGEHWFQKGLIIMLKKESSEDKG